MENSILGTVICCESKEEKIELPLGFNSTYLTLVFSWDLSDYFNRSVKLTSKCDIYVSECLLEYASLILYIFI